jgi:hypothetical protein
MPDGSSGIHELFDKSKGFICQGCSADVRPKAVGPKPKPPFCRTCREKQRSKRRCKRGDCLACGNRLHDLRSGRKYCRACKPKVVKEYFRQKWLAKRPPGTKTRAERNAELAAKAAVYVCTGCSKVFRPKGSGRTKYCSRECCFASEKWRPRKVVVPDRERFSKVYFPSCKKCRRLFCAGKSTTRYCSPQCAALPKRPRVTKGCAGCGTIIVGTEARTWCDDCAHERSKEKTRQYNKQRRQSGLGDRLRHHRHRARHHGVAYEPINPILVFERDRWTCMVCGVHTPKRLRGTYEDNAPELDHRIPMAMGGSHTWENVQCCCRACNGSKGASFIRGQLNLFPRLTTRPGAE